MSGVVGGAPYSYVAAVLAVGFALIAGFREHWIISTQRTLRGTVEQSREALAASRKQLAAVLESTRDSVLVINRDWTIAFTCCSKARGAIANEEFLTVTPDVLGCARMSGKNECSRSA